MGHHAGDKERWSLVGPSGTQAGGQLDPPIAGNELAWSCERREVTMPGRCGEHWC